MKFASDHSNTSRSASLFCSSTATQERKEQREENQSQRHRMTPAQSSAHHSIDSYSRDIPVARICLLSKIILHPSRIHLQRIQQKSEKAVASKPDITISWCSRCTYGTTSRLDVVSYAVCENRYCRETNIEDINVAETPSRVHLLSRTSTRLLCRHNLATRLLNRTKTISCHDHMCFNVSEALLLTLRKRRRTPWHYTNSTPDIWRTMTFDYASCTPITRRVCNTTSVSLTLSSTNVRSPSDTATKLVRPCELLYHMLHTRSYSYAARTLGLS